MGQDVHCWIFIAALKLHGALSLDRIISVLRIAVAGPEAEAKETNGEEVPHG